MLSLTERKGGSVATKRQEEASEQDRDGEEKGLALYLCDLCMLKCILLILPGFLYLFLVRN